MWTFIGLLVCLVVGIIAGFVLAVLLKYWSLKKAAQTSLWKYGRNILSVAIKTLLNRNKIR
jgi:hypothetical protein